MAWQEPIPAPWVHDKAREIVAGLKPRASGPNWLQRWLDGLDLPNVSGFLREDLLRGLVYALAAVTVAYLVYVVVRELDLRRVRRAGTAPAAAAEIRERVEALLARARAERAAGRRLAALRLYFAALVVALSRRGDLEYRDAWTNQELVARGAHSAELKATLAPLVRELDALVYGGQEVTEEHLDRLEGWCRRVEA